jgi:hypothetical protein
LGSASHAGFGKLPAIVVSSISCLRYRYPDRHHATSVDGEQPWKVRQY